MLHLTLQRKTEQSLTCMTLRYTDGYAEHFPCMHMDPCVLRTEISAVLSTHWSLIVALLSDATAGSLND